MSNFTYERNFPSKSGCSSAQSRTLDQSSRGQTCRLYVFSANIYVVALATEKLARPDPVQQTPEILKTVAVDGSSDILYRMFYPLLSESRVQALVKFQYIVKSLRHSAQPGGERDRQAAFVCDCQQTSLLRYRSTR